MGLVKAPIGPKLSCKGWQQEGLMRMLMNCLDGNVAENAKDLIVYGGTGKPVRNWQAYSEIISLLQSLEDDETLLIQSGKPVGVFQTFPTSPRVIVSSSMLVPQWANWETFRDLENKGLIMFGQATAASWSYIGTQGILQGTCETFGAVASQHFGGTLHGKLVLTSGLGGMGGAQPLGVTMHDGVIIVVEVDEDRVKRRLFNSYCDIMVRTLDEALELAQEALKKGVSRSIALLGNAAEIYPEFVKRGIIPDVVTDQTSAHDLLNGYVPARLTMEQANKLRHKNPQKYLDMAKESIMMHVQAMLDMHKRGSVVFDYGNNIREQAAQQGIEDAFSFPGFVPAFIRPFYCEGRGPCRWIALSGDSEDIYKIDDVILTQFLQDEKTCKWIRFVQEKIFFTGLPARTCWLNFRERSIIGDVINEMVHSGVLSGPIALTRDHMDGGAVASPNRETEMMLDDSGPIADWPVLNAMLNSASGATMVSLQHGAGVGIGYSIHAGMTVIADGSILAREKLQRVLSADPKLGIIRYADAGYQKAKEMLREIESSEGSII
ncbi:MAG: urocanate hydratase [Dehalobacterium sp.]